MKTRVRVMVLVLMLLPSASRVGAGENPLNGGEENTMSRAQVAPETTGCHRGVACDG
jgi:hypothetical protein